MKSIIMRIFSTLLTLQLFLTGFSLTVEAGDYKVRNESELITILAKTDAEKYIIFEDNVLVKNGQVFNLNSGDYITLDLDRYNFQGAGTLEFQGNGTVKIIGSTTAFNGGMQINTGNITFILNGVYNASTVDIFGKHPGDVTVIDLTQPSSGWNAATPSANYIGSLPGDLTTLSDGTVIIGSEGTATMNIGSGNWMKDAETIVGALPGGEGTLNISGASLLRSTGTMYAGFYGKGTVNITEGSQVYAGSVGIGKEAGSEGILNVAGTAKNANDLDAKFDPKTTTINIFGRDDSIDSQNTGLPANNPVLKSSGAGVMNITGGAHINFDERTTMSGEPSTEKPKLTLGTGGSTVDNSWISGALYDWKHYGTSNGNDHVGLIDGSTSGNNSLTFQNYSVLEGDLQIKMQNTVIKSESLLTPGYEKYTHPFVDVLDKTFGKIEFTNVNGGTFRHEADAHTIIDFDIFGDKNITDTATRSVVYDDQYARMNDVANIHDIITIDGGSAVFEGDVLFRPQSGYYRQSGDIDIHFVQTNGTTITGKYDIVSMYPNRWFNAYDTQIESDGLHLITSRNTSPFTDAANNFNTRGVGGALDEIFNAQNNYDWLHILDWTWLMNDDELRTAMHQLAGEVKASSFYMPLRSPWRFGFDRVNWSKKHNSVYFGTQNINDPIIAKSEIWANAYYDYLHMGYDGNTLGATTQRASFMAGYDRVASKIPYFGAFSRSAYGFLFGYSQPKLDQSGARVIADDYLFGAHFNTRLYNKYELKFWGGFGTQNYRLSRYVPIPDISETEPVDSRYHSKYSGTSWSGSGQIALPLNYRNGVIRPFAALDLSHIQQGSATEEGYEQAVLRYNSSDWTQLFGRIGTRADFAWDKWNLTGSLSYSYLLLGDAAPVSSHRFIYAGGSSFDIQGNNLGRSFLGIGLGTQFCFDRLKTSVVSVNYNGEYSKESNAQTFSIGYQKLF